MKGQNDGTLEVWIGANLEELEKGLQKAQTLLQTHGKNLQRLGTNLSMKVSAPLLAMGTGAVISAGKMEKLKTSFEVLLGSAQKADKMVKDLVMFSASTPFEMSDIGPATTKLIAYGFEAENIVDTLRTLGDVASAYGQNLGDIAYLYGTSLTQGRVMTKDIQQFTNRGIPLIKELQKQFNTTGEEVLKLAENGQIHFKHIEEAFRSLTSAGGVAQGMMEKQSKTILGLFSTLKDNVSLALAEVGDELIQTFDLKTLTADLISGIQSVVKYFKELDPEVKKLALQYGALATAIGPVILALGTVMTILSSLNPVVLATIGVLTALTPLFSVMAGSSRDLNSEMDQMIPKIESEVSSMNALFTALKNAEEGTEQRKELIRMINEQYGSYLPNLLTEKSSLNDIETAQKGVNEAMRNHLLYMAKSERQASIMKKSLDVMSDSMEDVGKGASDPMASGALSAGFADAMREAEKYKDYISVVFDETSASFISSNKPTEDLRESLKALSDQYGISMVDLMENASKWLEAKREEEDQMKRLNALLDEYITKMGIAYSDPTPTTPSGGPTEGTVTTPTGDFDSGVNLTEDDGSDWAQVWTDYYDEMDKANFITKQLGDEVGGLQAEMNAVSSLMDGLLGQGVDVEDIWIQNLIVRWKELKDAIEGASEASKEHQQVQGFAMRSGEALGRSLAGQENALKSFTQSFINMMMNQVLSLLIKDLAMIPGAGGIMALAGAGALKGLVSSAFGSNLFPMATGGAVMGPTAILAGEKVSSRGEAIIPFERIGEFVNQVSPGGGAVMVQGGEVTLDYDKLRIALEIIDRQTGKVRG